MPMFTASLESNLTARNLATMLNKSDASDFAGRFREIIADPLNLLIERHPKAGTIEDGYVILHNGNKVPFSGDGAYYDGFSDILIYNRGVHEPLEEFAFQEMLRALPHKAVMLELGAYWAHYSMWLKQVHPAAQIHMIEPDPRNAAAGMANMALNGLEGDYSQGFVGKDAVTLDGWMAEKGYDWLDVLHADIQGAEDELLDGAQLALAHQKIGYFFISTHSQALHEMVCDQLQSAGYRVELSADFDYETTSFDGFILALHPKHAPLYEGPAPMGREDLATTNTAGKMKHIAAVANGRVNLNSYPTAFLTFLAAPEFMTKTFSFPYKGTTQNIELPEKGSDRPSAFLIGLPKAGSTLLNRVMQPLCKRAGLAPFSLHNEMRRLGIPMQDMPDTVGEIYETTGHVYMGYRGLQPQDKVPSFASGCAVYLVRDPRDMIVSKYFSEAFSHRPPGSAADDQMMKKFEARRQKLQDMNLDNYVLESAHHTREAFENTQAVLENIEHRVWRYEDIVFDKLNWVHQMLNYLDITVPAPMVERVVARNDVRPDAEQTDAHVRRVTPGDHRNKLQPDTIEKLNDIFSPILARYNYS